MIGFAAVVILAGGMILRHYLDIKSRPPPRRSFATNNVPQAEAIKIVSGLRFGMGDKEALRHLEQAGLTPWLSLGCSHGWTTSYRLADGCILGLQIAPLQASSGGAWANGRLKAATIQSNGSNIVSIALKR